jgi:L-fucose mutarotase
MNGTAMLKSKLLHPQILAALGRAGHGSKVLISDGNYPHWTKKGPNAEVVYVNLAPGLPTVTDVLRLLIPTIPIEAAEIMDTNKTGPYAMKDDPEIWAEFRELLKATDCKGELTKVDRFKFYDVAGTPDVCLTIATGEQRIYANLLLTIGVAR